jgi:hypothetical protein
MTPPRRHALARANRITIAADQARARAIVARYEIPPVVLEFEDRDRRFRGSKRGRLDALGHLLRGILETDRYRAGKDIWGDLRRRADGKDPVIRSIEGPVLSWWPGPNLPYKKTTRKTVFNRLAALRASL